MVKLGESKMTQMQGPLSFGSREERLAYVKGPTVFWYHFAEEEDWNLWLRGGGWAATAPEAARDVVPPEPEITEEDRW